MDLFDAKILCLQKMKEHGLVQKGWSIKGNSRLRRIVGQCSYKTKEIILGVVYVEHNDEQEVLETILHEIAHALVGIGHGHDYVWRKK